MANKRSENLLGQETELAIRFQPASHCTHPGNKIIFDYFHEAIASLVKTRSGKRSFIQDQFFVQNGGAIYYEHHPQSLRKGLIETATPECSSTHELVLYQRAAERLLEKAKPVAIDLLKADGIEGELSLLKNCRDYEGNTYGSQENYDAELASGKSLWLFRSCLIAYLPIALVFKLLYVLLLLPFVFSIFCAKFCLESLLFVLSGLSLRSRDKNRSLLSTLQLVLQGHCERLSFDNNDHDEFLLKFEYALFYPLFWLSYKPLIVIYNRFAFLPQRQALGAHCISRIVYTGAGSLLENQDFILSEKSLAITQSERRSIHRTDKPIFDCGNLIKDYELAIWELFIFRLKSWSHIFSRGQRLQIAFSDSNRCHLSEFLKIGTTNLLVRMANRGLLSDAPQIQRSAEALHMVTADLDFKNKIETKSHGLMTVFEIQQWYLNQARSFLHSEEHSAHVTMEDHEVIRLWTETLEGLQRSPEKLIGRIDWVTKKYLLQTSSDELDYWELKKIDLKYHEIGTGYFDLLQRDGLTLDVFTSEEVETAVYEPSSPDRVKLRSRLIRSIQLADQPMTISWSQAKVGRWNPKVISLKDYQNFKDTNL